MVQARIHVHILLEGRPGNVVQMSPGVRGTQEKTDVVICYQPLPQAKISIYVYINIYSSKADKPKLCYLGDTHG